MQGNLLPGSTWNGVASTRIDRGECDFKTARYYNFLTRLGAYQSKYVRLDEAKMKKAFTKSSGATAVGAPRMTCGSVVKPRMELTNSDSKATLYSVYCNLCCDRNKGNYIALAHCKQFRDHFLLTEAGKRHALEILKCMSRSDKDGEPLHPKSRTYNSSTGELWGRLIKPLKKVLCGEKDANLEDRKQINMLQEYVKNDIFVLEIARCVVAPNEPIVSYWDGFAAAAFKINRVKGSALIDLDSRALSAVAAAYDKDQSANYFGSNILTGKSVEQKNDSIKPVILDASDSILGFYHQNKINESISEAIINSKWVASATKEKPTDCNDIITILQSMDMFKNCETQELALQKLLPHYDPYTGACRDTWENIAGVRISCYSSERSKQKTMQQRIKASLQSKSKLDKVILKLVIPDGASTKLSTITPGDALKEWRDNQKSCNLQTSLYSRAMCNDGLHWDDRGTNRKVGDNLLKQDISQLARGLNVFRMLPTRCLDIKMRDMTDHALRLNQQAVVLAANGGVASGFPMLGKSLQVQAKQTAWTVLLDGCHVSWLVDTETGKILVDAPHWKMAQNNKSGLRELSSSADIYYAQQNGILPNPWCPTYFLRSFRQALSQVMSSSTKTRRLNLSLSSASSMINPDNFGICDTNPGSMSIDPRTGKVSYSRVSIPEHSFK